MLAYDFADPETGVQRAVFDLTWPNGIQEQYSQPVALLLNESAETLALASGAGYRCFTSSRDLKSYIGLEILALEGVAQALSITP